jgi:hypothetical protein
MLWLLSVPFLLGFGIVAFGTLRSCASMDGRRRWLRLVGAFLFFGGFLNFAVFWFIAVAIGGDAVDGRVSEGRYYLASHGQYTEVSERLYRYSYAHTVSTWITHPLGFLGWYLLYKSRQKRSGPKGTGRDDEIAGG